MDFRTPRFWRMSKADDLHGWLMYFDSHKEAPGIRSLTEGEMSVTLDSVDSVSALPLFESKLGDQMDAFESLEVEGPSSEFMLTLWEGGPDGA